ncbi:hypothetical protein BLJ79_14615 [Arthrobacter sp. UCD-GKA]|uniref:glycosyltransferase n=1 Tax=Arthrobacter sp. UCD-GKA TaxID=1913576 RepID=UPI0008DD7116|nr:glycosyltransferase [Arthrobacter sp. UCD-GKA]OIH83330.1 hypothetical protein BLJ79_14615 [Arthrobacter sp. UCD-GKA]
MSTDVDHVLLTRFNLPSKGPESYLRTRDGWLVDRVELFERYCLPSVENQTCSNFHWIIYFDPESPPWLKEKIHEWSADGVFVAIYREEVPQRDLVADIRAVTGARHTQLISTNLDNDDGLAVDFVERLQRARSESPRTAIYLTQGLIKNAGRLYRRKDQDNAFCSVREDWSSVVTCWTDWHNRLALQMPVLEIAGDAAWLQVIHELNVSNRVRGRRTGPAQYLPIFGKMLDDVIVPGVLEAAVENIWHIPKRTVRDAGRSAVKNLAMKVAGKDGLEKLKNRMQQAQK